MSEPNQPQPNDEVDVLQLFKKISQYVSNTISSMLRFLLLLILKIRKFIFTNMTVLLLSGCIGAAGGYAYYYLQTKNRFTTRLLVESKYLKGFYFLEEMEKIAQTIRVENYDLLSKMLNTEEKYLKNIIDINTKGFAEYYGSEEKFKKIYINKEKWFIDSLNINEKLNAQLFMIQIKFKIKENSSLQKLNYIEEGIIHFFEKNKYVAKQHEDKMKKLKKEKEGLQQLLSSKNSLIQAIIHSLRETVLTKNTKLDSRNIKVTFGSETANNITDISSIYDSYDKNYQRIVSIEEKLSKNEKIIIVSDFSPLKKSTLNNPIYLLVIGTCTAIGIVTIIMLIITADFSLVAEGKYAKN